MGYNLLEKISFEKYYDYHSPGYVIEIYNNGIKQEYTIGNSTTKPHIQKVTSNTLYDIASLTKVFTCVLIYMAKEENKIDLNSTVYNIDNNFTNLKNTKIIDLLSHNQNIWTDGYLGNINSKEELYKILYSAYVKENIPTYVDTHYIILGILLEKIYNMSYDHLCQEKIFNVLEMKHTTFNPDSSICASNNYENIGNKIIDDIHPGLLHDTKGRVAKQFGLNLGHASIFTTGKDLLLFLESFLNNKLLKKETISLMLEHRDINKENKDILKKLTNIDDINKAYNIAKKDNNDFSLPRTYNNMGVRYRNIIDELNDAPNKASNNTIVFSGYTGPMFTIDFDKKIIVIIMCNIIHNSKLDRDTRKSITVEIMNRIFDTLV